MTPTRYPLQWPVGWKRTLPGQRQRGNFAKRREPRHGGSWRPLEDVSVAEACQRLLAELDRMGVREHDVVVSTNMVLRLDGLPRSGQAEPDDPGACVYWRDGGQDRCMAIDRYSRVAQNIAALAATIEAMRAIERHGGAAILNRAFTGFTALPAPIVAGMKRPWREVLDLAHGFERVTPEIVRMRYRTLAAERHPDREGGSDAAMAELNAARDQALQEVTHGPQ
jgi:hypothetical protein